MFATSRSGNHGAYGSSDPSIRVRGLPIGLNRKLCNLAGTFAHAMDDAQRTASLPPVDSNWGPAPTGLDDALPPWSIARQWQQNRGNARRYLPKRCGGDRNKPARIGNLREIPRSACSSKARVKPTAAADKCTR